MMRKERYTENIRGNVSSPKTKEDNFYTSGFTLMTAACICRNLPLVKAILKDMNERKNLFYDGKYVDDFGILSLDSIFDDNRTPLETAILSRDCTFVKDLIELGACVDFRNPLYSVMKLDDLEMEKVLLENGADICNVLKMASFEGNENIIFKILNSGYKKMLKERRILQSSLNLALCEACKGAHFPIIETLLEQGASINASSEDDWTPLHIAIGKSNTMLARYLIDKGSDCNRKEGLLKRTPLHVASQKHLLSIVDLLLKKGSKCNGRDIDKCTPLHLAIDPHDNSFNTTAEVTEGLLSLIQTLIDYNADITMCDKKNISPLLSACKRRMWPVAEKLIVNGANVNTYDSPIGDFEKTTIGDVAVTEKRRYNPRVSPLLLASSDGILSIVEQLIEKGAKVSVPHSYGKTPIHAATKKGFLEVVEKLIEHGSSCNTPDMKGEPPLIYALKYGHEDIALKLISNGAVIYSSNENYNSSLIYAFERGLWNIVEKFSTVGEDSDIYQQCVESALCKVLKNKSKAFKDLTQSCVEILHVVEKLIEKGADVNNRDALGNFPLCYAVEFGFQEVAEKLISHGAICNQYDKRGRSPLFIAITERNEDLCLKLIEHGSNVNLCNKDGESPLTCASRNGCLNVVEKLIEFGANVNKIDQYGNSSNGCFTFLWSLIRTFSRGNQSEKRETSPLLIATKERNEELCLKLIEHGSDINVCNENEESPLICASANGLLNVVEKLIEFGANVNKCDNFGESPLSCASKNGFLAVAESLIRNGAKMDIINQEGESPLFHACVNGHVDLVEALICNGATLKVHSSKRNNLLMHHALNKGNFLIAEKLIDIGADCTMCDEKGKSPFLVASEKGYFHVVRKLIEKVNFNKSDDFVYELLNAASKNGHLAVVQTLIKHKFDFSHYESKIGDLLLSTIFRGHVFVACKLIGLIKNCSHYNTVLHLASSKNYLCVVERLVKNGADCNNLDETGRLPLHLAAQNGCISISEHLLTNTADKNIADKNGNSPLHLASKNGHALIVKSLLEHGANCNVNATNKDGLTPLLLASKVEKGISSVVETLIQHGADLNQCDNDGKSPLHLAVQCGHLSVVKTLIQHGADVNKCDKKGLSPLHAAVDTFMSGQREFLIFKNLIAKGADCNKRDQNGESPLFVAIKSGDFSYVCRLIEHGADSSVCNKDGQSPLHFAVTYDKISSVKMLLDQGADINKCDECGHSPLDIAAERHDKLIMQMLIDHGAEVRKKT